MSDDILSEASPEWSLAELFNRNPLQLRKESPEAFARLILELRAQAIRNAQAEALGQKPPRTGLKASSAPAKTDLKLEDLL
jgi:hypothetical protein